MGSLFSLQQYTPTQALETKVLLSIAQKRKTSRRRAVLGAFGVAIVSLGALVPVCISVVRTFASSGASSYLSLVFTDGMVALSYWKEIALSVIEALPLGSIALLLCLCTVCLYSLRMLSQYVQKSGSRSAIA